METIFNWSWSFDLKLGVPRQSIDHLKAEVPNEKKIFFSFHRNNFDLCQQTIKIFR